MGSFQRETWIGRGGLHPPLSSVEGANGLELNLRLPSAPAVPYHGLTFTFTYNLKKNVEISQERKIYVFEISESAFKILNDTCSCVSLNKQLLITGLRIQVLWYVMVCS
jgi:hypothetical protein